MQLHLTLDAFDGTTLPINYRRLIHGMIYSALENEPDYGATTHGAKQERGIPRVKGFTFSPLKGQYAVEGHSIRFWGGLRLEIRAWDERLIQILASAWPPGAKLDMGGRTVCVCAADVENRHLDVERADIVMLSPVTVYRTVGKTTVYYRPDEPYFYEALVNNAHRKWTQLRPGDDAFALRIEPMFDGLPRKQFSLFKQTYITGWFGKYRLTGGRAIIDMLYQTGLGAKNPEGYGLFGV